MIRPGRAPVKADRGSSTGNGIAARIPPQDNLVPRVRAHARWSFDENLCGYDPLLGGGGVRRNGHADDLIGCNWGVLDRGMITAVNVASA